VPVRQTECYPRPNTKHISGNNFSFTSVYKAFESLFKHIWYFVFDLFTFCQDEYFTSENSTYILLYCIKTVGRFYNQLKFYYYYLYIALLRIQMERYNSIG